MKGTIRDKPLLDSLRPLEVAAYLRSSNWQEKSSKENEFSIWVKSTPSGEEWEALLPLKRDYRDFALRMGEILAVLEEEEHRSQMEIFADLSTTAADILRVRLSAPESADGTVPIDEGVDLVQHARDLVLAAACTTVAPRAWYRSRKPAKAEAYLRQVRLGQTEPGSYVLAVQSKVPPAFTPQNGMLFEIEEPFERQVMVTLARALTTCSHAAERAASTGNLQLFAEAIPKGISVNLCDAIAGLRSYSESLTGIRFEFTWSRLRPLAQEAFGPIVIAPDAISVIEEAGRLLRATSPLLEDVEIRGIVVRLDRTEQATEGVAMIVGTVEGQSRKVQIRLEGQAYDRAIRAHQERATVFCVGDVEKHGNTLVMDRPRDFTLVEDQQV